MTCANTLHDKEGLPAKLIKTGASGDEGLSVFVQGQSSIPLDLLFLQKKVTGLTLGINTVIGEREITLLAGHGLTTANSAGHIIDLTNTVSSSYYRSEIVTVIGNVANLSAPIPDIYDINTTAIYTGNANLCQDSATGAAIDGSVTPVIFSLAPSPSQSGDITIIKLATTSPNGSDLTTFGGAPPLVAGMTLRIKKSDDTYKNIFTYRTNFDIAIHGNDTQVFAAKLGNTTKGILSSVSFYGQGIRLDGALGEELEIIIYELMDNTNTGNITVKFLAEGSELQN